MRRREYMATVSAGTFSISGCTDTSELDSTDSPENQAQAEVEWDGELQFWSGSESEYLALITGQIYNVGDAGPIEVEFESALVDQDDNRVDSRERIVRGLVSGTRQQYFFRYYLSEDEVERVDDFRVEGDIRD